MNRRTLLPLLLCTLVASACDEKSKPASTNNTTTPAPKPASPPAGADERLQISGSLESKSGLTLQYKQAFDGGHITDLAACSGQLFARTDGGRIVEWDPKTRKVKQVLRDFGAVTSIDASDSILLAGTADGRLLRSTCEGREPVASPEPSLAAHWVHLDVRSQTRAFVFYREPATPVNKLPGTMVNVALVDLETGRATREPFRRAWPAAGVQLGGFVDYRGELWFTLTPEAARSTVWYLERFDETQPDLAGFGEEVMRGFIQMSREVWGFGGSVDGASGFIYRVDTNRAKPLWDGEKAWFGSRPGGDVPSRPIVGLHKRGTDLIVISSDAVYRTDKELRRWRRLTAADARENVLHTATNSVELLDTIFVGTQHGLVAIDDERWERFTVPESNDRSDPPALAKSVSWGGADWGIGKRDRLTVSVDGKKQRKPLSRPKRAVSGFFVDASDRLFIFADDGLWMLTGVEKEQQHQWDVTDLGIAANVVKGVGEGGKNDVLEISTSYGGHFRLRVPR